MLFLNQCFVLVLLQCFSFVLKAVELRLIIYSAFRKLFFYKWLLHDKFQHCIWIWDLVSIWKFIFLNGWQRKLFKWRCIWKQCLRFPEILVTSEIRNFLVIILILLLSSSLLHFFEFITIYIESCCHRQRLPWTIYLRSYFVFNIQS